MTTILPQDMPANKAAWLALFAKIDGQLASIDGSLASINASLASINSQITTINGQISSINSSLTTINNYITALEDAWVVYTPTVAPGTGAFGALGAATGRYKVIGKTVHVVIDVTIVTNGTASGGIFFSMPYAARSGGGFGLGREMNVTGTTLQLSVNASQCQVVTYNNLYAGGNNYRITGSVTYERT